MARGKGGKSKSSRNNWSGSPSPSPRPRRSDNQPNYYEGNSDTNEDGNSATSNPSMVEGDHNSPSLVSSPSVSLDDIPKIVKQSEDRLKGHFDSIINDLHGRVQKTENNISELHSKVNEINLDVKNQFNELKVEHQIQVERIISMYEAKFTDYKKEVKKQFTDLEAQCNQKVKKLQDENSSLIKKMHDLEASKISASVVLSGNGLDSYTEGENATAVALKAIKDHLKLIMQEGDIRSAHRLGDTKKNAKANIVLNVSHEGVKINLINASRKMKCKELSANEHLTKSTVTLVRRLRKVKRENANSLRSVFTLDGIIHARIHDVKGSTIIRDEDDLTNFLLRNNLKEIPEKQ